MRVSVITPATRDREVFNTRIKDIVASQDYANIEHLIDFSHGTIGFKRNKLCSIATGEIIIHADSDDWYAPDWISRSVAALGSHSLTGLSSLYFYKPGTNLWLYRYPLHERPWVAGATMCYRRSYWEKHPFDEHVKYGEDNKFVWGCNDVAPHVYMYGFLASIHPNNTSPKITTDPAWHTQPLSVAKNILKGDYEKYLSLLSTEAVKP